MARKEFQSNIRIAVESLQPSVQGVNYNVEDLAGMIERASLWLTLKATEGFVSGDWNELAPPMRVELENAVVGFNGIASKIPPNKPASVDQSQDAKNHLVRIANIVLGS